MELEVSIKAEELFHLGPLTVTNSMLTMVLVMIFLSVVSWSATRKMRLVPGGLQNLYEAVIEMLLALVENTVGRNLGRKIFPLIATLFLFITTANWFGLFPGFGTIGFLRTVDDHHVFVPLLRAANADLNMTLAMAILSVTIVELVGFLSHGLFGYIRELATPWFLFPVHLISELSRIVSLSARLFGNIFGGEVLVTIIFYLVGPAFFIPTMFLVLEMLFGLIQALIFSVLTLVYIALAAAGHGGEHQEATH